MGVDPRTLYLEGYDVNAGNLRKRMITERALMSNDYDIPLTKIIGGFDSAMGKFGFGAITDTKYEWMYDGPLPQSVALAGALTAVASLGNDVDGNAVYPSSTVAVGNAEYLHVGMVCELPVPIASDPAADATIPVNELVLIEAIDYAAGTVTIRRGFANTPVYAQAGTETMTIIGTAGLETQEWVANYQNRRGTVEGYWQTFFAGWQDTVRRQIFQSNYGDEGDELERSKAKIIGGSIGGQAVTGLLPLQFERSLMYGRPFKGNPQANIPSTFGGITSYAINKPVFNTTLTYDNVMSTLQTIYEAGGMCDLLVCSPAIKKIISGWSLTNRETYGATRAERDYGVVVDRIVTDFGNLDIVMSRQMNKAEAFLLDTTKIGAFTAIPWTEVELPVTDTPFVQKWMYYGTFGFILTHPTHHAWIRLDVESLRNSGVANIYTEPAANPRSYPGTVV